MRGDDDFVFARCVTYEREFVALVEINGDLAALSLILEVFDVCALDNAAACDHYEVFVVKEAVNGDYRRDFLARIQLDYVDRVRALRRSRRLGYLVRLLRVNSAEVGEHQESGVRVNDHNVAHKVLFLRAHADYSLAAAALSRVNVGGNALDVARIGHRDDDSWRSRRSSRSSRPRRRVSLCGARRRTCRVSG